MPVLCPAIRPQRPPNTSRQEEPLTRAAQDQDGAGGHAWPAQLQLRSQREGGAEPCAVRGLPGRGGGQGLPWHVAHGHVRCPHPCHAHSPAQLLSCPPTPVPIQLVPLLPPQGKGHLLLCHVVHMKPCIPLDDKPKLEVRCFLEVILHSREEKERIGEF